MLLFWGRILKVFCFCKFIWKLQKFDNIISSPFLLMDNIETPEEIPNIVSKRCVVYVDINVSL